MRGSVWVPIADSGLLQGFVRTGGRGEPVLTEAGWHSRCLRLPAPGHFEENRETCNLFNSVRESVRCLMKPLSGVHVSILPTRLQEAMLMEIY